MVATASGTANGSVINVSGTGHSGAIVTVIKSYVSTDGRRRTCEMYTGPIAAGSLSVDVPNQYTSGTVTIKALDPVTGAVLATSSGVSV